MLHCRVIPNRKKYERLKCNNTSPEYSLLDILGRYCTEQSANKSVLNSSQQIIVLVQNKFTVWITHGDSALCTHYSLETLLQMPTSVGNHKRSACKCILQSHPTYSQTYRHFVNDVFISVSSTVANIEKSLLFQIIPVT